MDLNEIFVFAKVVRAGSFTGAARDLSMPKSTVSRKVAELEERLGARLLHRTTRKLSLTDVGQSYYEHAARVVAEAEEAELAVGRMQETPRGLLRVTSPLNFGYFGPILSSFLARYPSVQLELLCADRVVDLIQEGFDVAIRAGRLADSSLVARNLGTMRSYLVASPVLFESQPRPSEPRDLQRYDCIRFGAGSDFAHWKLRKGNKTIKVDLEPRFTVNDFDVLDDAVNAGVGIALLPIFRCIQRLRNKTLERVLPDWCAPEVPLHAVYPSTRHLSPKVKVFLDHLVEHMSPPPWELGPSA